MRAVETGLFLHSPINTQQLKTWRCDWGSGRAQHKRAVTQNAASRHRVKRNFERFACIVTSSPFSDDCFTVVSQDRARRRIEFCWRSADKVDWFNGRIGSRKVGTDTSATRDSKHIRACTKVVSMHTVSVPCVRKSLCHLRACACSAGEK